MHFYRFLNGEFLGVYKLSSGVKLKRAFCLRLGSIIKVVTQENEKGTDDKKKNNAKSRAGCFLLIDLRLRKCFGQDAYKWNGTKVYALGMRS